MIILKEFLWRIIEWFYEKMQEFGGIENSIQWKCKYWVIVCMRDLKGAIRRMIPTKILFLRQRLIIEVNIKRMKRIDFFLLLSENLFDYIVILLITTIIMWGIIKKSCDSLINPLCFNLIMAALPILFLYFYL